MFICQVIAIYAIITASIYNLSADLDKTSLWVSLLRVALGICYQVRQLTKKKTKKMFHMTLPSNSSFDHFPNYTLSEYTTKLPQEINLEGSWEVGIAEISYPRT